jgi:hypothetical protein
MQTGPLPSMGGPTTDAPVAIFGLMKMIFARIFLTRVLTRRKHYDDGQVAVLETDLGSYIPWHDELCISSQWTC